MEDPVKPGGASAGEAGKGRRVKGAGRNGISGVRRKQPTTRAARHARKEPRRSRSRKVTRSRAAARAP